MISQFIDRIEKAILELDFPDNLPELYDPITYTMTLGGKRIRPVLVMLAARLFKNEEDLGLYQGLGIEMFHNFSLVHDDIMDNAPLRRGKPSVYKKWDQNTAILSGDVMFASSVQLVGKCEPEHLREVLDTFLDLTVKVCEGQQMDMNFENREDVALEEYVRMIELKTAILMAGSLKIGATVAGADENERNTLFEYGMKAGTAFQMMDDYLDAFGDPEKFGKKVGGDIMEGKKTYLYIVTKANLNGEHKAEFLRLFEDNELPYEDKVPKVKEYFNLAKAGEELKNESNKLLDEAFSQLDEIELDGTAKQELITLTKSLVNREK